MSLLRSLAYLAVTTFGFAAAGGLLAAVITLVLGLTVMRPQVGPDYFGLYVEGGCILYGAVGLRVGAAVGFAFGAYRLARH